MDFKKLIEKRNQLIEEMEKLVNLSTEETRAFTEDEEKKFNDMKVEIDDLDKQIKIIQEARSYEVIEDEEKVEEEKEDKKEEEKRAFCEYVKNGETRDFKAGSNGDVIPQNISNQIIEKVKEISPILGMTTQFYVGGDLKFPVYEEGIQAAYVDEFEELTESSGKFTVETLKSNIVGALTKVSKSLINRTDIGVFNFILKKVAESFSTFLEKELITGKTKSKGLASIKAERLVTAPSGTAITADDLIDLQLMVPEQYQNNACWIMNKKTLAMLRKLKNQDGEYILNKDVVKGYGFELLGRPVYFTSSMPEVKNNEIAVYYGDMSGLYVKFANAFEMQILKEKFATQYATGIVAHTEFDSAIIEPEKIAGLKMGA